MRLDFYQLSRDPAETAIAQIAQKSVAAGKRLLVVADDEELLTKVSKALWSRPDSFLAHDKQGGPHDARQPILLADAVTPANGATMLILADGQWRENEGFERVFLFFDNRTIDDARGLWRETGKREGVERHFWRQEGSKWVEAG